MCGHAAFTVLTGPPTCTRDAVGPDRYTFEELVHVVAMAIGRRVRIVHVPPSFVAGLATGLGLVLRDVMLTRDELQGLIAGLVAVD